MSNKLMQYVIASRPWSFPVSTGPVILAAILAHHVRPDLTSIPLILFTWLTATIFHAVANLLNTYCDYITGFDAHKKSDDRTLVDGLMRPREMLTLLITLTIASVVSFFLLSQIVTSRSHIAAETISSNFTWLCVFGVAIGYVYSAPPFALKHYALGDLCMIAAYGPVLTAGAYMVFTSELPTFSQLWMSLPNGILTTAILHSNNTRDQETDAKNGAITVPMLLGARYSVIYFIVLLSSCYILVLSPALVPSLLHVKGHAMITSEWRRFALALPLLTSPHANNLLNRFTSKKFSDLCPRVGQHALMFDVLHAIGLYIAMK